MSKRKVSGMWVLAVMLVSIVATAESLSDFQKAVNETGCAAIPYSSLRETCSSRQHDVDDYCKSRGEWGCDDFDPAGLKKQIENVKRKIEDLKRERDDLSSKKSNAKDDSERRDLEDKFSDKEKEIRKFEEMVAGWEKQLDTEQHQIRDRIYIGERCRDNRSDVAKAFTDAKYNASRESDPDIKPLAQKLVEHYDAGEPGHTKAINDAKQAVEKCKGML